MMRALALLLIVSLSGCAGGGSSSSGSVTADDANKFIDRANQTLLKLGTEASQADWVANTYITDDTQALTAKASQVYIDAVAKYAKEAVKFDKLELPADIRRQLTLLKVSLVMVNPSDPREGEELTKITAGLNAAYGKGKWCTDPEKPETCLDIDQISNIMAENRDEKRLRQVWQGWHTISPPMKKDYSRFV